MFEMKEAALFDRDEFFERPLLDPSSNTHTVNLDGLTPSRYEKPPPLTWGQLIRKQVYETWDELKGFVCTFRKLAGPLITES